MDISQAAIFEFHLKAEARSTTAIRPDARYNTLVDGGSSVITVDG